MKKKDKEALNKIVGAADRLVADVQLPDLLILTGGFIAGTQGWTPLSAILKVAPEFNLSNKLQRVKELVQQKLPPEKRVAVNSFLDLLGFTGSLGGPQQLVALWGSGQAIDELEKLPDYQKATEDEKDAMKQIVMTTICMGIVGMIEAYVITRPGKIAEIGEILKGIGEIVPG